MYLTSEYITMTKEWTGTWDKQGTHCLKYDKVEECIKIQCIFLFYYPVCVNQGTFVREPKVEQQQLKPPPPCPSMTIHLMCQDIRWCLRTSSEVMGHHVMSHDIMSTWCPNLAHCALCPLNLALNLEDDEEQEIFDVSLAVQTEVINDKECPMQFWLLLIDVLM